jgi:hypothetical protein
MLAVAEDLHILATVHQVRAVLALQAYQVVMEEQMPLEVLVLLTQAVEVVVVVEVK